MPSGDDLSEPAVLSPASRWTPGQVAGVALAVLVFAVSTWALRGFVTDDAWITYRYADNLANGFGFVWNPGGPVVEGYSNPLLVGIEAVALRLGVHGVTFARVVGVISGLLTILLVGWRGRSVVGPRGAASAAVLVGAVPGLAFWAVGGLETSLVTLLVTMAVVELAAGGPRSARRAGLALAVLPWLRPEGVVVVLIIGLFVAVHGLVEREGRWPTVRNAVVVTWPAVLAQVVLQVQRLVVFGHLLPNSAIYKADGDLLAVPLRFLSEQGPLLLLGALGLAVLAPRAWVLAVPVVTYLVAGVDTADSVNAFSRFLLPTLPAVALAAGMALQALARASTLRPRWWVHIVGVGATVVLVALVLPGNIRDAVEEVADYEQCREEAREQAARWVRNQTDPDAVVSISDAGVVPAQADRHVLDQFWLNDPRLQEVDGKPSTQVRADRLFEDAPDVIILASTREDRFRAAYPTDERIAEHNEFSAYHRSHVASGGEDCRYVLHVHERVH